ncbi:DUF6265 family protein [Stenotrophomonas sp.]|uniref:DUF6265 family protein n=1 Tax=Stenotrophomonas sp. TaxID=69392 RepID=UPI0028AADF83|nr:DUF6265 family protein [Stenotrophomonas sp.]
MSRSALMLVLSLLPGIAAAAEVSSLGWLLGDWQRTGLAADRSGSEQWRRQADALVGEGRSYRQGKLQFEERLRIIEDGGLLYYVADVPGNPAPVRFGLVEQGDQSAVFENPQHDYPQRIAYRREGRQLTATVSGGTREQVFQFTLSAQAAD